MSSTSKGNKFEAQVFTAIRSMISEGRFFCSAQAAKVFHKKGYYSKDRDGEIIFDIAVEIYLPGRSAYSVLVLIECKDYGSPVPVDDAEEFFAKIDQVSGANIKGLIVSTNSFAAGTLKYCEAKGIGLARYYEPSRLKWVLDRSPSSLSSSVPNWLAVQACLSTESARSLYFDFLCCANGVYTNSLQTLFTSLLQNTSAIEAAGLLAEQPRDRAAARVERLTADQIERRSEALLASISYAGGPVPLESICASEASRVGLVVEHDVAPDPTHVEREVLGQISFQPLKITVFARDQQHRGRERFTLAHELGHHVLGHSRYMAGEYCEESDFEQNGPPTLGIEDIARMEWQANRFASSLLLPRTTFISDFYEILTQFHISDRGHGALYVDEQKCNLATFYAVTDVLRRAYTVSRKVVQIRLSGLGLLNDARNNPKRIFER